MFCNFQTKSPLLLQISCARRFINSVEIDVSPVSPAGGSAFPSAAIVVVTPKLPFHLNKKKDLKRWMFQSTSGFLHSRCRVYKKNITFIILSSPHTSQDLARRYCCLATLWPLCSFRFWILNYNLNVFLFEFIIFFQWVYTSKSTKNVCCLSHK